MTSEGKTKALPTVVGIAATTVSTSVQTTAAAEMLKAINEFPERVGDRIANRLGAWEWETLVKTIKTTSEHALPNLDSDKKAELDDTINHLKCRVLEFKRAADEIDECTAYLKQELASFARTLKAQK